MDTQTIKEKDGKLSPKTVITELQKHVSQSKVFNAMMLAFAMRERTRQQVTVHNLVYSLKKEGYEFTRDQYRKELKFLGGLGIGKLHLDRKGRVSSLKSIHFTLQSVGLAALSKSDKFETWKPTPLFKQLPTDSVVQGIPGHPTFQDFSKPQEAASKRVSAPVPVPTDFQAFLTVIAEGKTMQVDLLPALSTADLLILMSKAMSKKEAK